MNPIKKIIEPFHPEFKQWDQLKGLTTQLQDARPEEIVFYRLHDEKKSHELFQDRMSQSKAGLVIVEGCPLFQDKRMISLNEQDYLKIRQGLLDAFYPLTGRLPSLIGITGTNGKSTVVHLLTQILEQCQVKALSLGTLGLCDAKGAILENFSMTTPSEIELRKTLHQYRDLDVICMEVSSHALTQNRLGELRLKLSGWTSFSQDHLDYHKTMEDYLEAKKIIIQKTQNQKVYLPESEKTLQSFLSQDEFKTSRVLSDDDAKRFSPMLTLGFNRSNLELALGLASEHLGYDVLTKISPERISLPKGRLNGIARFHGWVIIDYAHTPDALERVCSQLKAQYPKSSLTVVFGCGGNRDKTKRPLMRMAVESYADKIIVTSDNPRDEDPQEIINDILIGTEQSDEILSVVDRTQAIKLAIEEADESAIILIAGKGHETYQEIKGKKYPFDDFEVVRKIMDSL